MSSNKEELLAKKVAEVDALKREILEEGQKRKGQHEPKLKQQKIWPIVLGILLFLFVGLPFLLGTVSELSLSPEEKAVRDAESAADEVERLAIAKERQIKELRLTIDAAINGDNHSRVLEVASKLEVISPEDVVQYSEFVKTAKAAVAEQERQRKLNFTGKFYIGSYVDEFGEQTGQKFVGHKGSGKFSNSATEGSALNFWIALDSPRDFDISLFEYAGKNPVKDIFGGDAYIIRFRYSDVTGQVTCKNLSDRISCGPQNSAKLHAALKAADNVKFSIYNQRTTSSQYSFVVNANGYTNAMRKLGE